MTDPGLPAERTSVARPLILVLLGIAVLAAGVTFVLRLQQPATPPPVAALPAPPPSPSPAPPPAPPHDAPGFDIVRISPQGDAVIAGHAAPGAEVSVSDAGREVGRATADTGGNWVIVPTAPLPPGARELTLSEKLADGTTVNGAGSVVMVVPGAPSPATGAPAATTSAPALAVLDQPGAAPRVLQAPTAGPNAKLAFAAVDYDDRGELRFAGTAPPGAPVRVYIDNRPAGDATADAQGRWTLSPAAPIAPGAHHLRVDQIDRRGAVVARVEVPFQREQLTAASLGANRVVVQPGESLWRLARQTYGNGLRYTVIYQANQAQIRSPDKIYPGQTLTVPQDAAQPSR
jgi:nucleoid-associated protein YgaU